MVPPGRCKSEKLPIRMLKRPYGAPLQQLESQIRYLKAQIAAVGEMCPGSLAQRCRKCGKPACHCARRGAQDHGPDWVLTRQVQGKTVIKAVPEGAAVEQPPSQIEQYRRFPDLASQPVQLNERSSRFQDLLRAVRRQAGHNEEARKCFQHLRRSKLNGTFQDFRERRRQRKAA